MCICVFDVCVCVSLCVWYLFCVWECLVCVGLYRILYDMDRIEVVGEVWFVVWSVLWCVLCGGVAFWFRDIVLWRGVVSVFG